MLEPLADGVGLAVPLGLTLAVMAGRARACRRRRRLNRALHELRRPLQALRLGASPSATAAARELELALDALEAIDREVNGGPAPVRRSQVIDARSLAADAVTRWRRIAGRSGRRIEFRWQAGGSRVACDPPAISRALDNLISNAVEHGAGPIRVDGVARAGRLRLMVADGAATGRGGSPPIEGIGARGSASRWRRDPRRGHGLRIVAEVAAAHGGRFATCRRRSGSCAVLELPLADR